MQYQAPTKRPRAFVDQTSEVHEIVSAIHMAVTTKQRFQALERLLGAGALQYDHKTKFCNPEPEILSSMVEAGVVNSLCLQLGFVLNRHGSCREEIELLCIAIEIFHRYCPELITEETLRARLSELLGLLQKVFERNIILPVLSVWHSCSSCNYGTTILMQKPFTLPVISEVIRTHRCGDEGVLEALGLLKNITYYGEEFRIRKRIVEHPGLITSLTSLPESDPREKVQERVSAVVRNLALSSDTRVLLAQQSCILTAITRMANSLNRQTLHNLMNTLVSLTMDGDSSLMMVLYGDGIIIEVLKRFVAYEDDAVIRRRAARALRLMARETSAPLLVHDNQLMEFLSHRALHDVNNDVRQEAAEAFARLAGLIKAPMPHHDAVLDALSHLACSPNIMPDVLARASKEQASHPENRRAMAQRENLMIALSKFAISDETSKSVKENVCSTFLDLSDDESNRTVIATPLTLEALVKNIVNRSLGHARIREFAVRTLLNLAVVPSNRRKMAKHASLLQALLHFAAATQVDELKKEVKSVILNLAAEL